MDRFFELYDCLAANISSDAVVKYSLSGQLWAYAEVEDRSGIAMFTEGSTIAPLYPEGLAGMSVRQAVTAAASWNLEEASLALAAANAYYNTLSHAEALNALVDDYSADMDFSGKTVGVIGHLKRAPEQCRNAKALYILERSPQPGDYPDSACELLLPQCDVVLITGSALINKTLPRLLELCRGAYTAVVGPSVPLCPALLELGIDRLSGMIVTDTDCMRRHVLGAAHGSPYPYGRSFVLSK